MSTTTPTATSPTTTSMTKLYRAGSKRLSPSLSEDNNSRTTDKCEDDGTKSDEEEEATDTERYSPPVKRRRLSLDTDKESTTNSEEQQQKPKAAVKAEPDDRQQSANRAFSPSTTAEVTTTTSVSPPVPPMPPPPHKQYPHHGPVPFDTGGFACAHCDCPPVYTATIHVDSVLRMREYFENEAQNDAFKSLLESVPNISIRYDQANNQIVVKSFSADAIERVHMLASFFMQNSEQREKVLFKRKQNSRLAFGASFEANMYDANFLQDVEIPRVYTGLALGSGGTNLKAARALNGIIDITHDESQKSQGISKFRIYADTAKAAEQARAMLEFSDRKVTVPKNTVGHLIGSGGRNIKEILNKSGIVRISIDDGQQSQVAAASAENITVTFILIGTPETINKAELMIEFQLRHIRERDSFDDERDELDEQRRQFYEAPAGTDVCASQQKYDNSAFDHWTSSNAATEITPTSSSSRFNSRRMPRYIAADNNSSRGGVGGRRSRSGGGGDYLTSYGSYGGGRSGYGYGKQEHTY